MNKKSAEAYFDEVYAKTFPSVSRFVVSRCGNVLDSEDILQEIYSRFFVRITKKGYEDIENAEAFLINLAKFECKTYFMTVKKESNTTSISDFSEEQAARIEAEMSLNQKRLEDILCNEMMSKEIYREITSADEMTGKIFYLHFALDLTLEDTAKELDIPLSALKSKLYRMIEKLKKKYRI